MRRLLIGLLFSSALALAQSPSAGGNIGSSVIELYQINVPPVPIVPNVVVPPLNNPTAVGSILSSNPATVQWIITFITLQPIGYYTSLTVTVSKGAAGWGQFTVPLQVSDLATITVQEVSSVASVRLK